jgi:hypothetical protein
MRTPKTVIGTFVVVLAGFLANSPLARATEPGASESVSKTLADAKNEAIQIKDDAQLMETFTYSEVDAKTQGLVINQVRDHVNTLGKHLAKLKAERASAEPWQKTAIDRIGPLMADLSSDTEMVIDQLNGTNGHLNFKDYKELLEAHADESTELATLISDFVDYGRTKERLARLTSKLELPAKR